MLDLKLGVTIQMKKPHPCGSKLWEVYRIGGDIGMMCLGCRRRMMKPRSYLQRRAKLVLPAITDNSSQTIS